MRHQVKGMMKLKDDQGNSMLAWAAASGSKAVFEAALASLEAKLPDEVRPLDLRRKFQQRALFKIVMSQNVTPLSVVENSAPCAKYHTRFLRIPSTSDC